MNDHEAIRCMPKWTTTNNFRGRFTASRWRNSWEARCPRCQSRMYVDSVTTKHWLDLGALLARIGQMRLELGRGWMRLGLSCCKVWMDAPIWATIKQHFLGPGSNPDARATHSRFVCWMSIERLPPSSLTHVVRQQSQRCEPSSSHACAETSKTTSAMENPSKKGYFAKRKCLFHLQDDSMIDNTYSSFRWDWS